MSARWGQKNSDARARLAQSAERKALNLVVVGSSPTVGGLCFHAGSDLSPTVGKGHYDIHRFMRTMECSSRSGQQGGNDRCVTYLGQ